MAKGGIWRVDMNHFQINVPLVLAVHLEFSPTGMSLSQCPANSKILLALPLQNLSQLLPPPGQTLMRSPPTLGRASRDRPLEREFFPQISSSKTQNRTPPIHHCAVKRHPLLQFPFKMQNSWEEEYFGFEVRRWVRIPCLSVSVWPKASP